jgi:hypothetical protein
MRSINSIIRNSITEIELEENEQRKALTAAERSRKLLGEAQQTAEALRQRAEAVAIDQPDDEEADEEEPGEFSPIAGENLGGRPPQPDSERLAAEVLGVVEQTLICYGGQREQKIGHYALT